MPEIRPNVPSFAVRVFEQLSDGDYITIRAGNTRGKAKLIARFGPDGREADELQTDLDEEFISADGLSDAICTVVESCEGFGTVWVELYATSRKRAHDRVVVDSWPSDELSATPSLKDLTKLAGGDVSAAALAKAFDSRNMAVDGLLREVRQMAQDARNAGIREVEAARAGAIAEVEARILERVDDGDARAQRAEQTHQMMVALINNIAPALVPVLASWTNANANSSTASDDEGPPPEPGTPEADAEHRANVMLAEFRALSTTGAGKAAILKRKAELVQLVQEMMAG
jgi:hypothetical protein